MALSIGGSQMADWVLDKTLGRAITQDTWRQQSPVDMQKYAGKKLVKIET